MTSVQLTEKKPSIQSVVDGGYCIGCGACACLSDSPVRIALNEVGKYQAHVDIDSLSPSLSRKLATVCPFTGAGPNEDELGRELYADNSSHDSRLGFWRESYIGHVEEGNFRSQGSSGGFVSWLICELLSKGEIDGVLHVVSSSRSDESDVFFQYGVSTNIDDIKQGAKSRYYAVEMSQALGYVRDHPGRYLVVGVPCFIKAIRLLCRQEPLFSERIRFSISILCGHLKSVGYLEFIAQQMGVPLNEIQSFDFRHKNLSKPAKIYSAEIVYRRDGVEHKATSMMHELKGMGWGDGLFKYSACDYCDDIMGETADVSAGDAWIEPFSSDPGGTSIIVVRNKFLHQIIETAKTEGRLTLQSVLPDVVVHTQSGSFRHRRDGLSYRLWLKQQAGIWAPEKRVQAGWRHLSGKYRRIFKLRQSLVRLSDQAYLEAKKAGDLRLYWPRIKFASMRNHLISGPLWRDVPRKLWRMFIKSVGLN